jgi:hypothetical protein
MQWPGVLWPAACCPIATPPSLLANQHVTLFSHTGAHHHQRFAQTVTSRQSDKTQHNSRQAMNTHLQQGMGTALVHVLLSNGGALDVITRTDKALLANAELHMPAWKHQKPGHLYGLAVLRNYNYDDL